MDDKMIKALMSGKADKVAELRRGRSLGGSSKLKRTLEDIPSQPPVPSVPPIHSSATTEGKGPTRVFIGDMQRYQTVTITQGMTAAELLSLLEGQGVLKAWVGVGQWVLFEQVHDLGMERPIRPFESLPSVISGWAKTNGGSAAALLVRMHDIYGVLLGPARIPEYSPVWKGWVEWEVKRGKWNKRWLELREHGIWIAKKDGVSSLFLFNLRTIVLTLMFQGAIRTFVLSSSLRRLRSDAIHILCA